MRLTMLRAWRFPAVRLLPAFALSASLAAPHHPARVAARPDADTAARLLLLVATGIALGLRLVLWDRFPLREDEALYAYWARVFAQEDPLLLAVWPDKPPLLIWLLAGTMWLLGEGDAALRWLNIAASVLTVPLAGAAARRLWGNPVAGGLAALLLALNPYAVSFAPTVYTDPLLVLWGSAALVCALCGRAGWAGVWLAAAVMTKQQGVAYLPLVLALVLLLPARNKALGRLLGGGLLVAVPVVVWDSLRWHVAPSPWDLAQRTYAPLVWLPPATWWSRGQAWGELLWYLTGSWAGWLLVAMAGMAAATQARRRPALWLLMGWGLAFVVAHGVVSFQVWDRYLLPLAPWVAVLVAGPSAQALAAPRLRRGGGVIAAVLALILVPPAWRAAQGGYPIGADHGDYQGLHEAIDWVRAQPGPLVLYHQPLGWHYRHYLYPELQPAASVRGSQPPRVALRWFPSAAYLADNAAKTPYPPAYLIVPDWGAPRDLALHLAQRGLAAESRLRAGRFTVVEIVHLPARGCDWCRSQPRTLGGGTP